ncbi:MAG TPA: hemerythrin domain-containing protein [Candidatus Baltobacteraceae bacterium]|nr:hemerythrin domain-containing protein [Candidatus Baltobacteraceae bacterium]
MKHGDPKSVIEAARSEHTHLRRIMADIGSGAPNVPPNIKALLGEFADALRRHLELEDECLYPDLCSTSNAVLRRKARRYQLHMGGIAEGFALFCKRWRETDIASSSARFWEDWKTLESALLQRMESEDRDLYPAATEELAQKTQERRNDSAQGGGIR